MRRPRQRDNTGVISGAPGLVGTVPEVVEVARFRPNPWNPTGITEEERDRIRVGFRKNGWLVAQALLVWRTDEAGAERNVIVDGEQRWTVARELGIERGPVSFLDGISEARARSLTVELNARRAGGGRFDPEKFRVNLAEIGRFDASVPKAPDFGLDPRAFDKLVAPPFSSAPDQTDRARVGFVVLVDCDDEEHQLRTIEDLMSRGYKCRALT